MNILNKEKILEQARAFIDEGKLDRAIREYEKILLADPGDLRVKLRIAELQTRRKQIQDAIRIYREVADSYVAQGFYLKAVTVFKNILRINPALTEINEHLANLYEKMGLTADALRQYDILATALDQKGDANRTLDIRARIVNLNPEDGAARIRLAELYQREGRTDEAIKQYEEYAKHIENGGTDRSKLADVYEKILAHKPDRQDLMRKLIMIYMERGDKAKTLKWMEKGKDFVDVDTDLIALQAKLYAEQNQNETARTKYLTLAELHKQAGDTDAALEAYCEILAILPDEEERLAGRIEELKAGAMPEIVKRAGLKRSELEAEETRKHEDRDRATETVHEVKPRKAVKTTAPATKAGKPSETTPGLPKTAEEVVVRTLRLGDGDAAFDLGMAYLKMNLTEEARAEFEKALKIYTACAEAGIGDSQIQARVTEITEMMRDPAKEGAKKATPPQGIQKVSTNESGAKKKKKVSFV